MTIYLLPLHNQALRPQALENSTSLAKYGNSSRGETTQMASMCYLLQYGGASAKSGAYPSILKPFPSRSTKLFLCMMEAGVQLPEDKLWIICNLNG